MMHALQSSERPLRIGLLMHSLNPRGGVVHTLELADALCERGHEVTVFAPATLGQTLFRNTRARLSTAAVQSAAPDLPSQVAARMSAMALHLSHRPDLLDFDVLHSQDSITSNALATLRDAGRIPGFVRTVHHLDQFDDTQLSAWQTRGVRAATQVLCVSKLWQNTLKNDWGVAAQLVPNGVNLDRFSAAPSPAQKEQDAHILDALGVQGTGPVWLAVGGIEARKNTQRLLLAFSRARAQAPQAQLVIAGGASLLQHDAAAAAFSRTLQDLGLASHQAGGHCVRITGPVPDQALPALYRRATALTMPSLTEGFGLVALEALACGTPAIVSRIAPFTEHFAPHEVLWADPLDVDDIALALLRSLDPSHTQSVLAAAIQVCQRMSWERSALRHADIYRALLHHGSVATTQPSAWVADPNQKAHQHA